MSDLTFWLMKKMQIDGFKEKKSRASFCSKSKFFFFNTTYYYILIFE